MIVNNELDEVKKRENALNIIKKYIVEKGRNCLYDFTGLAGGFIASDNELDLLETYVGPAIFEEELQEVGLNHLGGEKIFPVNRTSSGILATILSLVPKNSYVVHFLAKLPGHPSIPLSCNLVNANYREFEDINEFLIPENCSLVVITGSTMDHQVVDEYLIKKIIEMAHNQNIPVLVDDASGARLRTVVFNQEKACDLGADIVITSTDKLMPGPRGGIIAGRKDLINKIKAKANQFGLEAQPSSILAMVNGLKAFNGEDLIRGFSKKEELFNLLKEDFSMFKKTPMGVMITPEDLANEIKIKSKLSNKDLAFLFSMILLKEEGIITIPAVSMPGASATIRFDLSTKDAYDFNLKDLKEKIVSSFNKLLEVAVNEEKSKEMIFN